MMRELRGLWAKHSILEAKAQQEQCRPDPDLLRIRLLERMQTTVIRKITAIEDGETRRRSDKGRHEVA